MRLRTLATVPAVVLTLLAAVACSARPGPPEDAFAQDRLPASSVDVDTPQLRRLKRTTGVEPCPPSDPRRGPVEDGLPDVTLPCLGGGRPVHLAGLHGKPLVLNLWASWCTPCREELPVLQAFYERADGKVAMLGVDFEDTQPDAALQLLKQSGVTYPQVADFDKVVDQELGRHPVPMTVLVDPHGEVVAQLPLQVTSVDQLAELVEGSLGVRV
ncbi:MAG: TlpA family protein disulfide reductase [Actinomycetota bacterium]|nr:TlpA family protein disulfide reductase [Actinomycetota bacterium]